jgi:hypothetical protein
MLGRRGEDFLGIAQVWISLLSREKQAFFKGSGAKNRLAHVPITPVNAKRRALVFQANPAGARPATGANVLLV